MAASKDRSKQLLNNFVLADNNFLKFLLHKKSVLRKFLQHVIK
jgi:hypothetical protein